MNIIVVVTLPHPHPDPTEWMLYQAYDAAEAGDWSIFHELGHLFLRPYDEHLEARYYRTTPMEFRNRQGSSFYN